MKDKVNQCGTNFSYFDLIGPQSCRIRWKKRKITAIAWIKVITDFGKAETHMRLPISE